MQKLNWIDSHCHLDFSEFPEPLALLDQLINEGCQRVLVPAISARYFNRVLTFQALKPEMIDVALGLHPYFLEDHKEDDLETLRLLVSKQKPQAVGEIGLDYMLPKEEHRLQMEYFEQQLCVADQFNLPVIIHCRKAHDELIKASRVNSYNNGGIIHAFSGSQQQARQYLDAGFVLGLGGALTYDRAKALHRLVAYLPDDGFVLETDSPDMAPAFARDQINSPLNIPRIAQHIAEIRKQTLVDIYLNSSHSYRRILNLY